MSKRHLKGSASTTPPPLLGECWEYTMPGKPAVYVYGTKEQASAVIRDSVDPALSHTLLPAPPLVTTVFRDAPLVARLCNYHLCTHKAVTESKWCKEHGKPVYHPGT
jgi:hypothetical protein